MQKNIAVKLQNISKVYKLYEKPADRLKEALHPLNKKYHKNFYALKNINLEIKKGEVLGIVGVNGAGKSTLLKIISEVLTPTSGRVNVHGRINAILELGSGLKPEMTGKDNIKLNLLINGIEQDQERITQEIIDFADIGEHINQPVKTYSSGMSARLGFGLATVTDPDILIVDEVLAVGDDLFKRKCYARIEKFFKEGKTVIFVSHSAQSVIEFCSRAVLLYDREIIMDDMPKKVTDFYQKIIFSNNNEKILNEVQRREVPVVKTAKKVSLKKEIEIDEKFYIEGLNIKPTEYMNYDVDIFDVMILNEDGNKVNILETGKKYVYTYKARFLINAIDVGFGMQIKTEKGLKITSSGSVKHGCTIKKAKIGDVFDIKWSFVCVMLEGMYFTNVGITSIIENERVIINRLVDAYVFKVKENFNKYSGLVSLSQQIKINNIND